MTAVSVTAVRRANLIQTHIRAKGYQCHRRRRRKLIQEQLNAVCDRMEISSRQRRVNAKDVGRNKLWRSLLCPLSGSGASPWIDGKVAIPLLCREVEPASKPLVAKLDHVREEFGKGVDHTIGDSDRGR